MQLRCHISVYTIWQAEADFDQETRQWIYSLVQKLPHIDLIECTHWQDDNKAMDPTSQKQVPAQAASDYAPLSP
ncbi:hypothetical protein D3C71_1734880 [compost metagenome]